MGGSDRHGNAPMVIWLFVDMFDAITHEIETDLTILGLIWDDIADFVRSAPRKAREGMRRAAMDARRRHS